MPDPTTEQNEPEIEPSTAEPENQEPAEPATPEPTPEPASKDGTFTQQQVNDIVAARVAREDAKYGDYDELKAKAAQADALQQKLDEMTAEAERQKLVATIANEKGVPAALLQNAGDTEEEISQAADALVAWKGETKPSTLPAVGGDPTGTPPANDWVAQLFAAM